MTRSASARPGTRPNPTFRELTSKELIVGGMERRPTATCSLKVINGVLGTKMKVISGYPGGNDITLAMQRGEKGRCGWSWSSIKTSHQDWCRTRR